MTFVLWKIQVLLGGGELIARAHVCLLSFYCIDSHRVSNKGNWNLNLSPYFTFMFWVFIQSSKMILKVVRKETRQNYWSNVCDKYLKRTNPLTAFTIYMMHYLKRKDQNSMNEYFTHKFCNFKRNWDAKTVDKRSLSVI